VFDVVQPPTDEALGGGDRVQGIGHGGGLCLFADDHCLLAEVHHGRKQVAPLLVR